MTLMNSDGFTRIGDSLYHWATEHEIYKIALTQSSAYTFLSSITESTQVAALDIAQHQIGIMSSSMREFNFECYANGEFGFFLTNFTPDCDDPFPLTRSVTIIQFLNSRRANVTVDWGDGTEETFMLDFNLTPGGPTSQGNLLQHTYSRPGAYRFEITVSYVARDAGSEGCVATTTATFLTASTDECEKREADDSQYMTTRGTTAHFDNWILGEEGYKVFIKKGRTLTGSRFRSQLGFFVLDLILGGREPRPRQADFDVTLTGNWRDKDCDHRELTQKIEMGRGEAIRKILVKPDKRKNKYYLPEDLYIDVELTFVVSQDIAASRHYLPLDGC